MNQSKELPTRATILLGAIAGDVIGSVYEHHGPQTIDFPLFSPASQVTDDSVLTIAVADAILHRGDYANQIYTYGLRYPRAGYGGSFINWLRTGDLKPYNSFGNGSAMRVSAVAWAFNNVEDVLLEAKNSAEVTHNHPEGIKGAQAVALAIYLARAGMEKDVIKQEITQRFGYDLSRRLETIRKTYKWSVTCQGSVPESIIAFLESDNFEGALRNAISLCGDADTMAAISGSIAEAYYGGVPDQISTEVLKRIPQELREVVNQFSDQYFSRSRNQPALP